MHVRVIEVSTNNSLKKFIDLPREIYKEDPLSVRPPQDNTLYKLFKTPYFRQNTKLLLAVRDNKPIARAAAIIDPHYPDKKVGFFGFFEAFDDLETTGKLFTEVFNWLIKHQKNIVIGPVTYNTNQLIGVLIEGFSEEPYFMTPYNPPYYSLLLNNLGFDKEEDFYAYKWKHDLGIPSKIEKIAARAKRIKGLKIRPVNFRQPGREAEVIKNIFNQAMSGNWGFRNLDYRDARQILSDYRGYADPDMIKIVEVQDRPAGICLAVPNINTLLRGHPQGLPLPLPHPLKRKLKTFRLVILGIVPDFRCRGLEAAMILDMIETARAKGYTEVEASLIHEKNSIMNKIITETMNCERSKCFRLYKKELEKI